jgi:hypothetical protein
MYRIIFRYRWAALLFALMVVGTTMSLVGTKERDGHLAQMQQQVTQQRDQFEQTIADGEPAQEDTPEDIEEVEAEPEFGFGGDAGPMDLAEGIDPTPDQPGDPDETDRQVELVNRDEGQQDF